MNLIFGFAVILYEFGIFPLAAGIWLGRKEPRISIHKAYIRGYLVLFTLFYCTAVPVIFLTGQLSVLVQIWSAVLMVSLPIVTAFFLLNRKKLKKGWKEILQNLKYAGEKTGGCLLLILVIFLLALTFSMPSEKDDTPETVNIAMKTGTMYRYQPYTQIPYDGLNRDKAVAPLEMLYAVSSVIAGIEPLLLIHMILPFFFLPFFLAVCWFAGRYFFKGNIEKTGLFSTFVILFYSAALCTRALPVMGILQNPWNGISLAIACGIPMVLIQGFRVIDSAGAQGEARCRGLMELFFMAVSVQLMISKGFILACVVSAFCAAISIYRKGIWNAGHFRKRKE